MIYIVDRFDLLSMPIDRGPGKIEVLIGECNAQHVLQLLQRYEDVVERRISAQPMVADWLNIRLAKPQYLTPCAPLPAPRPGDVLVIVQQTEETWRWFEGWVMIGGNHENAL